VIHNTPPAACLVDVGAGDNKDLLGVVQKWRVEVYLGY